MTPDGAASLNVPEGGRLSRLMVMLCHARGEPVNGKPKLQNMVFMLSRAYGNDELLGFKPGVQGPRSELVEQERIRLEEDGVLSGGDRIGVTAAGRGAAEKLAAKEPKMFEVVEDYKELFNDLETDEMLTYVFSSCPEMVEKSPLYDRIRSESEKHAMSMLRKDKISSGKAASLMGKPRYYVIKKAAREGIPMLALDDP